MATDPPSCFFIQFLEQLLKFLVNFTLLTYVKSQRSYGFLITKELIFGFHILDLKDHFSASLSHAVILISKFRTSASKKVNLMAVIQTLTISTATFERMKEKFYGFRQIEQ